MIRFYMFEGYKYPGEIIGLRFAKFLKNFKRSLSLREYPILGECMVYAVIRYDKEKEEISWKTHSGDPNILEPWRESVERTLFETNEFKSLVRPSKELPEDVQDIEIPYYSWKCMPLYAKDGLDIQRMPFMIRDILMDFEQCLFKKMIEVPVPGEWEHINRLLNTKIGKMSMEPLIVTRKSEIKTEKSS